MHKILHYGLSLFDLLRVAFQGQIFIDMVLSSGYIHTFSNTSGSLLSICSVFQHATQLFHFNHKQHNLGSTFYDPTHVRLFLVVMVVANNRQVVLYTTNMVIITSRYKGPFINLQVLSNPSLPYNLSAKVYLINMNIMAKRNRNAYSHMAKLYLSIYKIADSSSG